MITLKDSIEINTSLDNLYDWINNLDEHFIDWSPYHTEFKKLTGGLEVNDILQFTEVVDNTPYNIKVKILKKEKTDNDFIVYMQTTVKLANIIFMGEKTKTGCKFTHIEEFGLKDTPFGKIGNWLLFEVIAKKQANWDLILGDMKEDNLYLKNYLETGKYGYEGKVEHL